MPHDPHEARDRQSAPGGGLDAEPAEVGEPRHKSGILTTAGVGPTGGAPAGAATDRIVPDRGDSTYADDVPTEGERRLAEQNIGVQDVGRTEPAEEGRHRVVRSRMPGETPGLDPNEEFHAHRRPDRDPALMGQGDMEEGSGR
jgi:hypothetical protein